MLIPILSCIFAFCIGFSIGLCSKREAILIDESFDPDEINRELLCEEEPALVFDYCAHCMDSYPEEDLHNGLCSACHSWLEYQELQSLEEKYETYYPSYDGSAFSCSHDDDANSSRRERERGSDRSE